jgi:hypothetical protein
VGQTPDQKGPRAVWPTMFYVSLARRFDDMCLHEEYKAKAVEKVGGGSST